MRIKQCETAVAAFHAHAAEGKSSQQRERIVAFIARKGGDWSIGELAGAMAMEKSTVSARVNELLYDTRSVIPRSKRRDRISGVMVRPVSLPPTQRGLFE